MGVEVTSATLLNRIAEVLRGRKMPSEIMACGGRTPSPGVSTATALGEGQGIANGILRATEGLSESGLGTVTSSPTARGEGLFCSSCRVLGLSRTTPSESGTVVLTFSIIALAKISEAPIGVIVLAAGRLAVRALASSLALAV